MVLWCANDAIVVTGTWLVSLRLEEVAADLVTMECIQE